MKTVRANFMKAVKWVGLAGAVALPLFTCLSQPQVAPSPSGPEQAPSTSAAPADLSSNVAEVVRLSESGVGDEVVLAFIQNSKASYGLTADHVLYLRDMGLSSAVITAMMNHDGAVRTQPPTEAPPPPAPPSNVPPAEAPLTPPPAYVGNPPPEVTYFYNDLSPYGGWGVVNGVGWCWQPRAVVITRTWRPYCDGGHWIYTDCGWYWQSDYSWGWAPFHYGRWYLDARCGWVWTPDTIWGPAWVTWRVAGDHCGWAPLPPHAIFDVRVGWRFNGFAVGLDFDFGLRPDPFTFVALRDFHERDFVHHRLAPTEVTKVYNRTTIINNYTVNKTTVVNRGIPVEHVEQVTQAKFQRATVHELPSGAGKVVSRGVSQKGVEVVYRPQLKAPAKPAIAVAQKVDERHPAVYHTAIAPATAGRKPSPLTAAPAPSVVPHGKPAEGPQGPQRSGGERPAGSPPVRSQADIPKAPQRSDLEQPAGHPQKEQPVARGNQPTSVAPVTPAAPHPASEAKPAAPSTPAYTPATAPRSSSAPPAVRGYPSSGQKEYPAQNPHVYYPKSYHQEADTRSAGPNPKSQPTQREVGPSGPPGRGGEGQSKRKDF